MALFIPVVEPLPADYWTDRAGQAVVAIVAHGTGGTDSRSTLQHGGGRKVSIHRLITKTGKIYLMVPDHRGANHAGAPTSSFTLDGKTYTGGQVNQVTLGFELENLQNGRDPYTDPQLSAMGWQIAEWRKVFGAIPVLRHADLDPTRRRDPYQLSTQDIERWAARYTTHPTVARAGAYGALARQDYMAAAPTAAYFPPGTVIELDDFSKNSYRHAKSGIGFIAEGDLVL